MEWLLLPFLVGVSVVAQGGLNRVLARDWGLASVIALNALVFLASCLAFYAWVRCRPQDAPEIFRDRGGAWRHFAAWHAVPGLCGFVIVAGVPWAIPRLGAFRVFVIMLFAQLAGSLVWDALAEGNPLTLKRTLAAGLALAAVAISNL